MCVFVTVLWTPFFFLFSPCFFCYCWKHGKNCKKLSLLSIVLVVVLKDPRKCPKCISCKMNECESCCVPVRHFDIHTHTHTHTFHTSFGQSFMFGDLPLDLCLIFVRNQCQSTEYFFEIHGNHVEKHVSGEKSTRKWIVLPVIHEYIRFP